MKTLLINHYTLGVVGCLGQIPMGGMVIGDWELQLSLNPGDSVCEVACLNIDMTVD